MGGGGGWSRTLCQLLLLGLGILSLTLSPGQSHGGTHCSCVAVRLGSGCASWGPSCLLLDSWFLPCRGP